MAHAERKRESPWAHAGPEPHLRDLLSDSIVIAIMTKDKVKYPDFLRLITSIRRKIRD
ncbi:MAG TPA: hypothetical protein VN809_06045 [Telmatospirillum sp.]|nr:hypothetical protein [Telmatospirillum sp.]